MLVLTMPWGPRHGLSLLEPRHCIHLSLSKHPVKLCSWLSARLMPAQGCSDLQQQREKGLTQRDAEMAKKSLSGQPLSTAVSQASGQHLSHQQSCKALHPARENLPSSSANPAPGFANFGPCIHQHLLSVQDLFLPSRAANTCIHMHQAACLHQLPSCLQLRHVLH